MIGGTRGSRAEVLPRGFPIVAVDLNICLATYNGEKFLWNFYSSLKQQTYTNWSLIVRDDLSTDSTPLITKRFLSEGAPHVATIESGRSSAGTVENFSVLLCHSTANYVMLADQDDIWYPDKILDSLTMIRALEMDTTSGIRPAVVFTDLHVVDETLTLLHPSYFDKQGMRSLRRPTFRRLLTQNVAPGCTMIVNRELLNRALPIPHNAVMHDWWLMLVASLFGVISCLDKPTMAYRQHGNNQVGARGFRPAFLFRSMFVYRCHIRRAEAQAAELVDQYRESMTATDLSSAEGFANLPNLPPMIRQLSALRHRLFKAGWIRNAAFYTFM
jgi:glycosyltransferase involved in cell wall biosynthesis